MNRICLVAALTLVGMACAPKVGPQSTSQGTHQVGADCRGALPVTSIEAEYAWIHKNLPGAQVVSQALGSCEGKPVDILTVELPGGGTREVYFDISSFFGRP